MDIKDGFVISVKPALKSMLGRLRLLRTADWRSTVQQLERKRKRCARRQKRGKLTANRRPIPSLFLANVRSLDNKMNLICLRLGFSQEMRNCAVLCFMETWLNDNMPDSAFPLDGQLLFRADCNHLSGKTHGGVLSSTKAGVQTVLW